jgi:uncharacterized repeat protein (TIGR01451 family)
MASVSYNGESIIWKIPVTNLSPFPNTNVIVSDVMSGGMQYASHTVTKGTFDPLTGVWTVGDMSGESTETLTITVVVTDITQAPFTNTATVTGSLIEANTLDNSFTQTVTVENCPPTGAGLPDFTGCLCIDVSLNDTKCTKGVTEWRLIPSSVTNSTSYHWDQLTGKGSFTPIDPTLPITGAYDLFCVQGTSITQISCNVLFTIYPQLEDKSIFDHTISHVKITDLTPADVAVLQSQNPDLVVADYCWQVIKNANGVVTSGIPLDCDPAIDNRTFLICTAVPCTNTPCPDCPILTLPADVQAQILADTPGYSPEKGDVVYIQHPNATSIYTFNGSGWIKSSCGCVYKISQNVNNDLSLGTDNAPFFDLSAEPEFLALQNKVLTAATVAGTTNKVLTLTFQDGTTLTAPFTDIDTDTDTNTTYSFSVVGSNLVITPSTGTPITLTLPSGSGLSSVAVNTSLIGDGTVGNPLGVVPGATPGQVLTWNGTSWVAASAPVVSGDNWGTQVIQHAVGSASSGDGTVGSPLLVTGGTSVTITDTTPGDGIIEINGTPLDICSSVQECTISATNVNYDDSVSLLGVNTVQEAIDTLVTLLPSEAQFAELYNISGDSTQTGNINTAQFTNESSNAKIHYTTSAQLAGLPIDTTLTARVLNSGSIIPNSITLSSLSASSEVTMSKTFFVMLNVGDVISFEVEDAGGAGIQISNTNLSVEYLV